MTQEIIFQTMSDSQSLQDTVSQHYLEHQSLNQARFINLSQIDETPSTRKFGRFSHHNRTRTQMKKVSPSDNSDQWERILTQSLSQCADKTPEKEQEEGREKRVQKTANVKEKQSGKLQRQCPICLNQYKNVRGSLDCQHQFCFECIRQWCDSSTVCPCCRKEFVSILKLIRQQPDGLIKQTKRVSVSTKKLNIESEYDHYVCYQCASGDNQHVLLICDDCDFYCCHVYCDPELAGVLPTGNWYCIYCSERRKRRNGRGRHTHAYFSMDIDLSMIRRSQEENQEISFLTGLGVSSRTRSHHQFQMPRNNAHRDRRNRIS